MATQEDLISKAQKGSYSWFICW